MGLGFGGCCCTDEEELGIRVWDWDWDWEEKAVGLWVKKIRSPEVIPRDWRVASGDDAWSSSLRFSEK